MDSIPCVMGFPLSSSAGTSVSPRIPVTSRLTPLQSTARLVCQVMWSGMSKRSVRLRTASWCRRPWLRRILLTGVMIWNDACSESCANKRPSSLTGALAPVIYSVHLSMLLVAVGSPRIHSAISCMTSKSHSQRPAPAKVGLLALPVPSGFARQTKTREETLMPLTHGADLVRNAS